MHGNVPVSTFCFFISLATSVQLRIIPLARSVDGIVTVINIFLTWASSAMNLPPPPSLLCLYYPALKRAFHFLFSCGINSHCSKVLITSAMHGLACRYSSLPWLRKNGNERRCEPWESSVFSLRNAFLPRHSEALHADQDLQRQFAFAHSKAVPRSITGPCSKFTSVLFLCT